MLTSRTARVVVLTSSPRVAPGLLTLRAWDTLRAAGQVLTGQPDHPQLPALAEAGIACRVVTVPDSGDSGDPGALASLLAREAAAAAGGGGGDLVWLADSGDEPATAALASALAALDDAPEVEVLAGARDLPGARILDLVTTMSTLRANCPWDAKQTHESLAPYLIEESYEALEALEDGDQAALREELGDVLLQVMFHAEVASERTDGTGYTVDDVADGIVSKLIRRHPHVFGGIEVSGADEVIQNWDTIKAAERAAKAAQHPETAARPASALDGVPFGQPALSLAAQLQRRATRAGLPPSLITTPSATGAPPQPSPESTPPSHGAAPTSQSDPPAPTTAVASTDANPSLSPTTAVTPATPRNDGTSDAAPLTPAALGDELFRLVALAQAADLDPERELRAAARRYRDRIQAWEQSHQPPN